MNHARGNPSIAALADEAFADQLGAEPIWAAQLGYAEHIEALPDYSANGRQRRRDRLDSLEARTRRVPVDDLGPEDRITHTMLLRQVSDRKLALDARAESYTVSPTNWTGLAAQVILSFCKTPLRGMDDAQAYLRRCLAVPEWLESSRRNLTEGAAEGRVPVARLTRAAVQQLDAYLETPVTDDPLVNVPVGFSAPDVDGWRDRLLAVVRDTVRPALADYRGFLAERVLPAARPDDRPGLAQLPGGTELYARLIASHTTTDRDAEQIHANGLELVAELIEEMRELGSRVLGTADFAEITERLRHDPTLFFETPEQILTAASDGLRRAQQELPNWLGRLPDAGCQVKPMTAYEVENGTLGYYQWPSLDGSRPGTYWVNTHEPRSRARFEAQALAFHESVPGHHTQLGLAQELTEQPEFRRHARVTAFSEGWALYTERLCDEMGLYTDEIYRLGMISFDFWRACRLVVDTGMHAMGWSRDRAVSYMYENSALTAVNVRNEIDRYIGWPGQALGYMHGRLQIRRLRELAERELGSAFVLRDFHSEVIGHGSLPLSVLAEVVQRWIERQRPAADRTPDGEPR